MAKYKPYDYSQQGMIPVSLEDQLVPGTLEFAIQTLVEDRLDMALFEDRYRKDESGRWAYDPKILFKVVLLGYARGLLASRKREQVCRENVTLMALTCGQRPDHSMIVAFVSSMPEEVLPLFRDVLLVCGESGLLGGTLFALDGCKLPSNASQEWSGKISDLLRKKEKMEKKVTELLRRQVEVDRYLSVPVGATPGNLTKEMAQKVDTERGRDIYHQRIGITEPVFANIRSVKRLDRFTLRGKIKVNIQWVLYCMVHNIGKIMSYGFA